MHQNFGNMKTVLYLREHSAKKTKTYNCGVRKQRQENGKRLQQTHQGRKTKDLFF